MRGLRCVLLLLVLAAPAQAQTAPPTTVGVPGTLEVAVVPAVRPYRIDDKVTLQAVTPPGLPAHTVLEFYTCTITPTKPCADVLAEGVRLGETTAPGYRSLLVNLKTPGVKKFVWRIKGRPAAQQVITKARADLEVSLPLPLTPPPGTALVEVQQDGAWVCRMHTPPWTCTWHTTAVGQWTFTWIPRDAAGQTLGASTTTVAIQVAP